MTGPSEARGDTPEARSARKTIRAALCAVGLGCAIALSACGARQPIVHLTEEWPTTIRDYDDVVADWTRKAQLHAAYQEVCEMVATFKSPEWRAAHAVYEADNRGLTGEARNKHLAEARAEVPGPYEIELMVTTWDRRENDLDRGKKSVWRVVILDEHGQEIEPLEVIKDRRPSYVVRAEFPGLGEFATPYIVRFPRTTPLLGPTARQLRLRMSSTRGGLEVIWTATP